MTTLLTSRRSGSDYYIYRNVDLAGWVQVGSYTVNPRPAVKRFRISPVDLQTIYGSATSTGTRFAYSLDAGATWGTGVVPTGERFYHIEPDSLAAGTVYAAGTDSGLTIGRVYKSTDYGATWTTKLSVAAILGTVIEGWMVCVAPNGDVFAQIADGTDLAGPNAQLLIYRSTDGGDNWSLVETLAGATGGTSQWLAISLDGTRLLSGYSTNSGGQHREVFESTDNGDTWTNLADMAAVGLCGAPIPNANGIFLANGNASGVNRVWKSTGQGVSFSNVGLLATGDPPIQPLDGQTVGTEYAFAVPHGSPTTFYALNQGDTASLDSRVYRSTDGGATWEVYSAEATFNWTALAAIEAAPDDRRTFLSLVRQGGKPLL